MADLSVTLGADTTEFEKKVKSSGKTLEKELGKGGKGGGAMGGINFAQNLMSGNIGAAVGGLFGPIGTAIGSFVDSVVSKAKELIDKAVEIRNLSLQTGLSTTKIQGLENIAKQTGISIQKLSDNISEFNRRLGYARTHGSEMNTALVKLGISFEDVKNGSFDYFKAIEALRKAQAAGTDQAILNHYAQVMLGSSYKELLPLIEMGAESIKQQAMAVEEVSDENISALTKFGAYWDTFWKNIGNGAMSFFGMILNWFQSDAKSVGKEIQSELKDSKDPKKAIEAGIKEVGYGVTAAQRSKMMGDAIDQLYSSGKISRKERKDLFDELDKRVPIDANGKPLPAFGLAVAGAASSMQQMGGGDIFGAIAFSPLERIANSTEQTAKNTTPKNEGQQIPTANITNINAQ